MCEGAAFSLPVAAGRCCCDSMAGVRGGCRFYTNAARTNLRGPALLLFFGAERRSRVDLVEVSLEGFFGFFGQARELNSHSDARIAGTNHSRGRQALFFDPQIYPEGCSDRQGHDSLNITSIAADVGSIHAQRCIYTFIA